jgi:hypothetical protein
MTNMMIKGVFMNTIDYIKEKTQEGWGFSIECKAKGRGYELSYQALASQSSNKSEDLFGWATAKHAVGDTLAECVAGLFGVASESDEEDQKLKDKMLLFWNMNVVFVWKDGQFVVTGSAKNIESDGTGSAENYLREQASRREAMGFSLEEMLDNLFDSYDPNSEYSLAQQAEMKRMEEVFWGRKKDA